MPRRTLARVAVSTTLAVSVLTGFAAMSASADEQVSTTTAPAVQVVEGPALTTADPEPVLFTAAYTRW